MVVRAHEGGVFGVFWGTWDDFWQETSIGGASNAGHAQGAPYIRRIIWIIIFTVFFYLTVQGVVGLFVSYYDYPVTYSVYVAHKNKVRFTYYLINYLMKINRLMSTMTMWIIVHCQ